jgi:hypothetical protein
VNWQDLARTVAKVGLPALGAALPLPGGAVVGKMIADALGVEPTPEAVTAALQADPDALPKLKKIEADVAAREMEHEETMLATATADVQRARTNDKDGAMRNRLAGLIFFSPLYVLTLYTAINVLSKFATIPASLVSDPVWYTLFGLTGGWATSVVGFYFGTSIGSSRRADDISAMMKK